jgi:hypothetical protein
MIDFVKQISEALNYLSERTDREQYIKLFPEGVKLLDAPRGSLNKKVERLLKRLYVGYMKRKANMIWRELEEKDKIAILEFFFPAPFCYDKIYDALLDWEPDQSPLDLIMLGRRVAENKEEMLKFDKYYEKYKRMRRGWVPKDELFEILQELVDAGVYLKHFKIEQDGTFTGKFIPMPYFHHVSILLHSYIAYILREMFGNEDLDKLGDKHEDIYYDKNTLYELNFEIFLKTILGYPLPDKRRIKHILKKVEEQEKKQRLSGST